MIGETHKSYRAASHMFVIVEEHPEQTSNWFVRDNASLESSFILALYDSNIYILRSVRKVYDPKILFLIATFYFIFLPKSKLRV